MHADSIYWVLIHSTGEGRGLGWQRGGLRGACAVYWGLRRADEEARVRDISVQKVGMWDGVEACEMELVQGRLGFGWSGRYCCGGCYGLEKGHGSPWGMMVR